MRRHTPPPVKTRGAARARAAGPKDRVAQFSRKEAIRAAGYLACIVGKAHARQLDVDQRLDWHRELTRNVGHDLDAPSCLRRSVVDLAGTHEADYLDHCRRYALE